jgi:hypothetical protein
MRRIEVPKWPLVVAALLAPTALQAQAGTLVCKDGSNGSTAAACASHGGVDSVSTAAARKARGGVETGQIDTSRGAKGVGPDTALKAKPGVQTGPSADTSGMAGGDTSKHAKKKGQKQRMDSTHMRPDSAAMRPDSTH